MCNISIVLIQRAEKFSPNNVETDKAILTAVGSRLKENGYHHMRMVREEELEKMPKADVYVTMGRSKELLDILLERQTKGAIVVNRVEGVRMCCHRASLMELLQQEGFPVAPIEGTDGYWVKRGDGPTQTKEDVTYVPHKADALWLRDKMLASGISEVDMRAHVPGDVVKFYGVSGTDFFRYYYSGDDEQSKFGDEKKNGLSHRYVFNEEALKMTAAHASSLMKTDVYGGDCIVKKDGSFVIIDFNDWPSFSRCREDAADAIMTCLIQKIKKEDDQL